MGFPRKQYHQWQRRKKYGMDKYQQIWYYERPFQENGIFVSAATVPEDTNVLEIYYHLKTDMFLNIRATEREMGRALKALFGCGKYICRVEHSMPLATVSFYTKVEEVPEPWKMEEVPEVIGRSLVEAGLDRWNYKTGEYQGRFYLSEFNDYHRCLIRKFCEGRYKGRQVLGSIWAFARA